jgi:hypothetical protein
MNRKHLTRLRTSRVEKTSAIKKESIIERDNKQQEASMRQRLLMSEIQRCTGTRPRGQFIAKKFTGQDWQLQSNNYVLCSENDDAKAASNNRS